MSIAEIAAAVIGLRETTYKDHQRLTGGFDELRAALETLRGDLDERVDKRLAASAQALVDLDRPEDLAITEASETIDQLKAQTNGHGGGR